MTLEEFLSEWNNGSDRVLERIEELLDQYELGETLWVEEKLDMDVTAGHSLKN